MRYVIDRRYRLRGWHKSPTGLFDTRLRRAQFFRKEEYLLLLRCDGAHDIDEGELTEDNRQLLSWLKSHGIVREAGPFDYLAESQEYRRYPARYRWEAHWSVTGACNLKCRHCFMSAPHAKHGSPTTEQLLSVVDQLAECGVFGVGITGGEPLIRDDLFDILDALADREIGVSTLYTNGWLVDEALLDKLEERHMRPSFQLSFDGVGCHDFLRGVSGAEERTVRALRLLRRRHYDVSAAVSLHRENRDSLRDTVRLLASLGVRSVKCGSMMDVGEWAAPEVADLQLTRQEELEMFERYIPQYFEDDAPLSIMMADTFMYTPGDKRWHIYDVREVPPEHEDSVLSCSVMSRSFYIGADGVVAPCMGMCDCGFAVNFPNLFETPLRDILRDSAYTALTEVSVGDVRRHNPRCRSCAYVDRCAGGCRNSVLLQGDDYYAIDESLCYFFENGWEERMRRAAEEPFDAYLRRNPPKARQNDRRPAPADCP